MLDKFKQSLVHAGDSLKEQAASIGEAARERGTRIMDPWISVLPKLEAYGFKTTFFGLSVSINPTLEIEMQSKADAFPLERVQAILDESKASTPVHLLFNAVKSTMLLHHMAKIERLDPLTVKIRVKLSPEIRVSFGVPIDEG